VHLTLAHALVERCGRREFERAGVRGLRHEHEQVLVRTDHLVAVHELERAVALLLEVGFRLLLLVGFRELVVEPVDARLELGLLVALAVIPEDRVHRVPADGAGEHAQRDVAPERVHLRERLDGLHRVAQDRPAFAGDDFRVVQRAAECDRDREPEVLDAVRFDKRTIAFTFLSHVGNSFSWIDVAMYSSMIGMLLTVTNVNSSFSDAWYVSCVVW
jgi:hypothetical protein